MTDVRKIRPGLAGFVLIMLLTTFARAELADPRVLVVMIEFENHMGEPLNGAGVIVAQNDRETLIVTAGHNLWDESGEPYPKFSVEFSPARGTHVQAQIADFRSSFDIGLLRVPANDAIAVLDDVNRTGVLGKPASSRDGGAYVVGFGGGRPWFHMPRPEPVQKVSITEIVIESSAQLPGQSGGAVFNEDWALIGMIIETAGSTATALPVGLVLDELGKSKYGQSISLRMDPLADQKEARRELASRSVSWSAEGMATALSAVDLDTLRLFTEGGSQPGLLLEAFRTRAGDGNTVARAFMDRAKGNPEAIDWLKAAFANEGVDPNMTLPADYQETEGLLNVAVRSGNAPAILALVEMGASPHAYGELWFSPYQPRFLFPFKAILDHQNLTRQEKADIIKAFVDAGGVIPELPPSGRTRTTHGQIIRELYEKGSTLPGVTIQATPNICERPRSPVCINASARSGFDWCAFSERLPKKIWWAEGSSMHINLSELTIEGLINVVDGKAYYFATEEKGRMSRFLLVEVSRDASLWNVYRFMSPRAGMGHCREDFNGAKHDDCWRKFTVNYYSDKRELKIEDYYPYRFGMSCSERDESIAMTEEEVDLYRRGARMVATQDGFAYLAPTNRNPDIGRLLLMRFAPSLTSNTDWLSAARHYAKLRVVPASTWPAFFPAGTATPSIGLQHAEWFRQWSVNRAKALPMKMRYVATLDTRRTRITREGTDVPIFVNDRHLAVDVLNSDHPDYARTLRLHLGFVSVLRLPEPLESYNFRVSQADVERMGGLKGFEADVTVKGVETVSIDEKRVIFVDGDIEGIRAVGMNGKVYAEQ